MAYQGYHFFVGDLELPYAPSELTVTIGSNNKTVGLIDGSEINVLKSPKLTGIKFEIELPRGRQYAFANKLISSKTYTDYFEKLMLTKVPTKLVITRPNPFLRGATGIGGTVKDFESNEFNVSLEGYTLKESANNAYDVKVTLEFKEYRSYGTVKTVVQNNTPVSTTVQTVTKPATENKTYTVVQGDNLWSISRKFYGTANNALVSKIYNANQNTIEQAARKYGKKDSNKGWWIYPGTKLTIPPTN